MFSCGSYKALIYIRTSLKLKKVIVFLTDTFTQEKRFLVSVDIFLINKQITL